MKKNELNFSGGPGALPEEVLRKSQIAIDAIPEVGLSILGISHRSDWFSSLVQRTEDNIRRLLKIGNEFDIIFLQGGSSLQFSMIPINFLAGSGKSAGYINSGYWSNNASTEAAIQGQIKILWDGKSNLYTQLPLSGEINLEENFSYVHYVSNETVEGLQFQTPIKSKNNPLICDMSSDFLSKKFDMTEYSMVYAHAQKNLGPSGVTVCIIAKKLTKTNQAKLSSMLDYSSHIECKSAFNTPPVFAIYVLFLSTEWLINDIGGLENMEKINSIKSELIYQALEDNIHIFNPRVKKEFRSSMNVTFNMKNQELEDEFLKLTDSLGMSGLKGHRSIGGLRASLYNGLQIEAAEKLANTIRNYGKKKRP